jgi:hypothetical protein
MPLFLLHGTTYSISWVRLKLATSFGRDGVEVAWDFESEVLDPDDVDEKVLFLSMHLRTM